MAITDLFRQTVTLVRTDSVARDAIGGATPNATTATQVRGYLEPRTVQAGGSGRTEELADRGTLIGDWVLYLPAATDVSGWDRVTYESHTFDVIGPPRPYFDPRSEAEHHIEIDLREVT